MNYNFCIKQDSISVLKKCISKSIYTTLTIFAILFLIFILFFKSSILNMGHMTALRLIRSIFFTGIVCCFLYAIFGNKKTKDNALQHKWKACLLWSVIWTAIYTIVFSRIPDLLRHDIGNYYIIPCLFFSISLLITIAISNIQKTFHTIFIFCYSVFIFFILLCPIFYAFYFMIYGQEFDEYALLSVIATNPDEIINYLTSTFSAFQLISISSALFLLLFSIFVVNRKITRVPYHLSFKKKKVIIFTLLSTLFFYKYSMTVSPIDQILHLQRLNGPMNAFIQLQNNIEQNNDNLKLASSIVPSSKKVPGSIIVVVGESANRDMMSAFNPSYEKNTTPWEKESRDNTDFIFFDNSFANFPNTVMAVTQALTSSNQANCQAKCNTFEK